MSIFDINFSQLAVSLLPPDKRYARTAAWLKSLLLPLQYDRDLYLGDFREGSDYLQWVDGDTYAISDRVIYKQQVYESLVASNTDNPTIQTSWRVVNTNFIGVNERILYTGNKLLFEYAINKYFGTTFRQPNNTSDIFIEVFPNPFSVFVIGADEVQSSINYSNVSSQFIINDYDFNSYVNMNINVPVAVFNALDASTDNCEKIIRNFANKYIIAGIIYQIVTY